MTVHDHREVVEGCFRCELSADELGECTCDDLETVDVDRELTTLRCRDCGEEYQECTREGVIPDG